MKTQFINISVLLLVLGLSIPASTLAKDPEMNKGEKETKVIRVHAPIVRIFTEEFGLSNQEIDALKSKIDHAELISFSLGEELEVIFEEGVVEWMSSAEGWQASQIEDWMLEELAPENSGTYFEDWMFSDDYLAGEESVTEMETWMFEEDYYSSEYDSQLMESWMFDTEYYESNDAPVLLETWMFEPLTEAEEEVALEDWMFDADYYDSNNEIESWMLAALK